MPTSLRRALGKSVSSLVRLGGVGIMRRCTLLGVVLLSMTGLNLAHAADEVVEVLARGPIHEAFAMPANTQGDQPEVITKQPPDLILEAPPDLRPAIDNVQWISGYWAWDDDESAFLWVSGCWRVPPPGRRWLPGHWQEVSAGWVWVAGLWLPEDQRELQYLPPPPPTADEGPTTQAPNENSIYIPGCWEYHNSRFLWQPGYWV